MNEKYNWYDRPQRINNWYDLDISNIIFIDENGSEECKKLKEKVKNNIHLTDDEKYFTLTACIFNKESYSNTSIKIKKLKYKYWTKGMYYDSKNNKNKYVCLHSREIRRHENAFNDSIINYNKFVNNLSDILKTVDCQIISVSIDLEKYLKKDYNEKVYEKAFDLLIKSYCNNKRIDNQKDLIILESRGKQSDKRLLKFIVNHIKNQNTTVNRLIKGIFFNPKWFDDKSSTYAGLEIADLFSYPIHQYIKYNKTNKSYKVINKKIIKLIYYPTEKEE